MTNQEDPLVLGKYCENNIQPRILNVIKWMDWVKRPVSISSIFIVSAEEGLWSGLPGKHSTK